MTSLPPQSALPSHDAYIKRERATGLVINCLLSIGFTVLAFRGHPWIGLWGANGIAADLVPTVFMLTLMGNLALSLLARKRLRDGLVAPMSAQRCGVLARRLPAHLGARLVLTALAVTVVVVPLSVLVLVFLGVESISYARYLGFKAVYGPLVGAISAAPIIEAALKAPAGG
jgi:hypothetical protein